MAALCSKMGIANFDWLGDDHSSTETFERSAASNPSPSISPLDLHFERKTGVTIGLGLVPYLARLWLEDPFDRRIVFGINMGIDHFSKSLVEGSKSNAFETLNSPNPNPNPNSLWAPLSEMQQPIFEVSDYDPFDSNYFLHGGDEEHNSKNKRVGSDDVSMEHAESEELVSSESSEYIYGGIETDHLYKDRAMEPWPGGLTGTFGIRPPNLIGYQYPTEGFMDHCYFCRNPIFKGHDDVFIFKGEYAFCCKQCRQVEVEFEEFKEKAAMKARKEAAAKRLESIGKFPVVFEMGPSATTN